MLRCNIKNNLKKILFVSFLLGSTQIYAQQLPVESVLTKEYQSTLTPTKVIALLKAGNQRFVNGALTVRNHSKQIIAAQSGQHPKAIIISCIDSRVPVEDVFDVGIGDVFVGRVAGNFENIDLLGSMEYANKVAGAKVLVVLGHESCGAVKSAIDKVELGNITAMLDNIKPAIEHFKNYKGVKTSKNTEFVHMVVERNVRQTIDDIRKKSDILRELEEKGNLKIVAAVYSLQTGQVTFLD